MIDLHKAIKAIHTNVFTVNGDTQETITAFDEDGNTVSIDWIQVNAWQDPNAYKHQRVSEYPPIGDQLDALFHAGAFPDDMAAKIQAVKNKYPKGSV
jgi:hypothetical protein